MSNGTDSLVTLPDPDRTGKVSLEEAISKRRSVRDFSDAPVAVAAIGQLCWATQGITGAGDHRAAPSAGALYPLEVYVVVGHADGLAPGVYRYHPRGHRLERRADGDRRGALCRAALEQESIRDAPVVFAITGVYERSSKKYGERGVRYTQMEAGHAAQNLQLQATTLGLVGVPVGAFDDDGIEDVLKAPGNEVALYLIPIGKP